MKKIIITVLIVFVFLSCSARERDFWYPIALQYVTCSNYSGTVYRMKHNHIWTSWIFYIDIADNKEIKLPSNCIIKTIRKMPIHKSKPVEPHLTSEQLKWMIEGI